MDVAPQAAPLLRRRRQPQGALPPRPQPDLLSAGLPPRPGLVLVHRRRTSRRLRRHIEPGGGTLFADAACGSPAFDAAFRTLRRRAPARQPPGPDPPRRRALLHQGRLRPQGLPVHQGRRRRQGLSPARGRQGQRPLGGDLLQVRHRLRPGAALGARLQGLHLRGGPQDRRQHRHLLHAPLTDATAAVHCRGPDRPQA